MQILRIYAFISSHGTTAHKTSTRFTDLLSVSNLVNYIGKQDKIDQVEISPVLLQKGDTKVALFGLGTFKFLENIWICFRRPHVVLFLVNSSRKYAR